MGFRFQFSKIEILNTRTQMIAEWNRANRFLNVVENSCYEVQESSLIEYSNNFVRRIILLVDGK